jgi:hypothetical protein
MFTANKKKEEGRRKKEEGRRKKEEGRRKKEASLLQFIIVLLAMHFDTGN